jgi:hypothetical protein
MGNINDRPPPRADPDPVDIEAPADEHESIEDEVYDNFDNGNNSALNRPEISGALQYTDMRDDDNAPEQPSQDEANARRLSYELDGIHWGGKHEQKRRFARAFTEALRSVDLTGAEKLILVQRYVRLVNHYRSMTRRWKFFCYGSRSVVAVGSVVVPILVAIDDEILERSSMGQAIAYTTMAVGFVVTLVNGFQELFQSTKQYISSSNTEQILTAEGWAFVSLSGRYRHYDTHSECWQRFFERVQKVNAGAHDVGMTLARGGTDTEGDNGKNKASSEGGATDAFYEQRMDLEDGAGGPPVVYANH